MRLEFGSSLEDFRAKALRQIDEAAETARLRFVTPGASQALEYQATESDARAYLHDASDGTLMLISDYPFLRAEIEARRAAHGGVAPGALIVAQEVVAEADAWRMIGSLIKELRRGRKMQVAAANSVAEIRELLNIDWPMPD